MTILRQIEAQPAAYPNAPDGLSAAAAALNPAVVWHRLETYCSYRWSERVVTWIVQGCGEFVPPLAPAVVSTIETWSGADEWETGEINVSPCGGYYLPASGPYRVVALVGDDDAEIPAVVLEAYRRLAEYMAADRGTPGASHELAVVGPIREEVHRSPEWMGRAMQNSGAADLLRPFRRAA